jgi:hypothetical protein
MNHSDWVTATGTSYVGLGGSFRRPPNPKLLPHLVAKAKPSALMRDVRRTILRVAQLTGEVDDLLSPAMTRRRKIRDASVYEQSRPGVAGIAAQIRHQTAVARARKL